ncbi:hypothetical protein RYX36_009588 [Vicia faba]
MVPSRENRGKAQVGENASGVAEQESIPQEPFMKQRRLLSDFRLWSIIIPKIFMLDMLTRHLQEDGQKECDTFLKNMIFMDTDGIFKYKNDENVYAPPPAPSGGYSLELIYNKMCEMDIHHSFELHELSSNTNFLKSRYRHQEETDEGDGEEGEEEEEEGEED